MTRMLLILALLHHSPLFGADAPTPAEMKAQHEKGAAKAADDQDELSADVQQLVIEQTVPEVIQLLGEVETLMDEVTDSLAENQTGGETLAAQTVIIEKIHQAAQKRQQQQGGGDAGGAMLDMMERMMGKEPTPGKGEERGEQAGEKAGKSGQGESDSKNTAEGTAGGDRVEPRRVPKAAGVAGSSVPDEFRQAMDLYNRGAEAKQK